jgi:hypothetical protein
VTSRAFNRALKSTGYLTVDGDPSPGLMLATDPAAAPLRIVLKDMCSRCRRRKLFNLSIIVCEGPTAKLRSWCRPLATPMRLPSTTEP